MKLFWCQPKVINLGIWWTESILYNGTEIIGICKSKHKFDLVDFPKRIISNWNFYFGVFSIIQIMSEVKEVFSSGVSHHVSLFDLTIKLFRLNLNNWREWYFFNNLISSASRNLDMKTREGITINWILNVLNFQI